MSQSIRQSRLAGAQRLVVKLGTQLLRPSKGPGLDLATLRSLAGQVAKLHADGKQVTVVSSGAIGAGCHELGLTRRPTDVAHAQAVAAVGQRLLMDLWSDALSEHKLRVGQVLLTRSDFDHRARFLNIRNCISHLLEIDCIPILNENDTVAVDEIRFGDNDLLAAMTANALRADALMLLTTVPGLLDEKGKVIDRIDDVIEVLSLAKRGKGARSDWGSGGMLSKLEAARLVAEAGEVAVIANGREKDILHRLLAGEQLGTLFVPASEKLSSRQRWIGLTARPTGTVTVDDGAAAALTKRNKSLLASGITASTGRFERGDVLLVRDAAGREVARGLSNYAADELRLIMGQRSSQFEKILGRAGFAEVIHRDNLVVLGE